MRVSVSSILPSLVALLVLPVAPVRAEPDAVPLPEVVVSGEQEGAYTAPDGTSATKTDVPLIEVPQAIRVVPEQLLEDRNAVSLENALQTVAGVTTGGYFAGYDYYKIRGFPAYGYTYLDGIPVDRNFVFGEELFGLERIEVLRGPSSSLYGQGPLGGLVNMISKRPRPDAAAQLHLSGGSYDFFEAAADVGGPVPALDGLSVRINTLYRTFDSFTEFVDPSERIYVAPALTWQIGPRTHLTLLGQYFDDDRRIAFALPAAGTVLPNPNGRIPIDRNVGEPDYQNVAHAWRGQAGWIGEHAFNDVFTLRQVVRWASNESRFVGIYPLFLVGDSELARYAYRSRASYDTIAQDTSLQAKFTTGPASHTAVAGVDYYRIDDDTLDETASMDPIDVFDPHYGARPGPFTPTIEQKVRADAVGVYVQEMARLFDQVTLLAGFRYDAASNERDNHITETITTADDAAITPRAGIVWEFVRGVAAYFSYSESFQPQPTFIMADGTPLPPETGQQYEIGFKTDLWEHRAVTTLSFYDLTRQNVATPDPINNGYSVLTGEQHSRGIELEGTLTPLRGWDIAAGASYIDAEVTKDNFVPSGTRLLNVPKWSISGWTKYTLQSTVLKGLGAGIGGRWYSDQSGDQLDTFALPAFGVLEGGVFYERGPFRGQVNVTNMLDARYFGGSYNAFYVLPGQPVAVTASVDWYF